MRKDESEPSPVNVEGNPVSFYWHDLLDDDSHLDTETLAIAARRREVAKLYAGGKSMAEIGRLVVPNVSRMTIYRDVQSVHLWFKKAAARHASEWIATALMRLDWLEAEITEQWERSKSVQHKTHKTKRTRPMRGNAGGTEETIRVEAEDTYGDPRLFQQMREIWRDRLELLGLLGAKRKDSAEKPMDEIEAAKRVKLVAGEDPLMLV